jgi:hypothetical protein
MSRSRSSVKAWVLRFSLEKPIWTGLALLAIAFIFKTGSLWVSWLFHFANNTILNLLHLSTAEGLDSGSAIVGPVAMFVALLSMLLVKYLAERYQMPEVKPWGQWEEA